MHLTLAFLGECNGTRTDAAKAAMDSVVFDAFDITVDKMGKFRRDGGDIWWAGARMTDQLSKLHSDLASSLSAAGFGTENRRYEAHITLGREIRSDMMPQDSEPFNETVKKIELMNSERIDGKLTYTKIHERKAM